MDLNNSASTEMADRNCRRMTLQALSFTACNILGAKGVLVLGANYRGAGAAAAAAADDEDEDDSCAAEYPKITHQ